MDGEKLEKIITLQNGSKIVEFRSSTRFHQLFPGLNIGNVMLKFSASWCNPCKTLQKVLEGMNLSKWNLQIVNVDIEACKRIADEYEISSIPVFLLFKDGKQVFRQKGYNNTIKLEQLFDTHFAKNIFVEEKPVEKEIKMEPIKENKIDFRLSDNVFLKSKNMFLN